MRILILVNRYHVVFKFRIELLEKLVAEGNDVWVCFPNGPFGTGEEAAERYGCHFIENHMEWKGTNLKKETSVIREYFSIIKKVKPDAVLTYTVKPNVYGGVVCRLLGVPYLINITGLGNALADEGKVQKLTILLYKLAVRKTKCIFFQNNNDKEFFDKHGIKYKKCKVIPGSGVNLEKLQPLPYPNESEPIRFVYVGRVMKDKGIEQYLDAARAIKNKYPNTEFHICGYLEEDYKDIIDEKSGVGEVIYHGLVDDIKAYDEMSHCVVLPSFYPEGISNSLLEGAAYARPLITTDHVGCKEAVIDGVSGYIVRQRDSNDLIEKMVRFIELPYDDKVKMGIAGRKFVEENFDRNIVVDAYMKELDLI